MDFTPSPDSTFYALQTLQFARASCFEMQPAESVSSRVPGGWTWVLSDRHAFSAAAVTARKVPPIAQVSDETPTSFLAEEAGGAPAIIPDPWLLATWESIAAYRDLEPGWDGFDAPPPSRDCLEAAESLAILISAKPMQTRPVFAVDSRGRPTFAKYDENIYLHLIVDGRDQLAWYGVAGGEEFFEDEVLYEGVALPTALNRLL